MALLLIIKTKITSFIVLLFVVTVVVALIIFLPALFIEDVAPSFLARPRSVEVYTEMESGFGLVKAKFYLNRILKWADIKGANSPSISAHISRLCQPVIEFLPADSSQIQSIEQFLENVTNDEKLYDGGFPVIMQSEFGVAYRCISGTNRIDRTFYGFSHRDQVIASLAENTIGLDHPVRTHRGRDDYDLADVLRESIMRVNHKS